MIVNKLSLVAAAVLTLASATATTQAAAADGSRSQPARKIVAMHAAPGCTPRIQYIYRFASQDDANAEGDRRLMADEALSYYAQQADDGSWTLILTITL